MSDLLKTEIISPSGELLSGNFSMVVVPSIAGDLGVMRGHEAVIVALREGEVLIYGEKETLVKSFAVKSGFAEVQDSGKLLVLID